MKYHFSSIRYRFHPRRAQVIIGGPYGFCDGTGYRWVLKLHDGVMHVRTESGHTKQLAARMCSLSKLTPWMGAYGISPVTCGGEMIDRAKVELEKMAMAWCVLIFVERRGADTGGKWV